MLAFRKVEQRKQGRRKAVNWYSWRALGGIVDVVKKEKQSGKFLRDQKKATFARQIDRDDSQLFMFITLTVEV